MGGPTIFSAGRDWDVQEQPERPMAGTSKRRNIKREQGIIDDCSGGLGCEFIQCPQRACLVGLYRISIHIDHFNLLLGMVMGLILLDQ